VAGPEFSFSPLDLAIIGLYAAVILGKGIWLARARADADSCTNAMRRC